MKLSLNSSLGGLSSAFTMAEILLSLTIIGVVAAITLPSLTGNINERTWATQKKALHSRLSQAVSLLDGLRGYGTINVVSSPNESGWGAEYYTPNGTETFLTSGLSKVMKLNNICDSSHISDCGMPNEIMNLVGSKIQLSDIDDLVSLNSGFTGDVGCGLLMKVNGPAAAFETQNGESVLAFYNPMCKDAQGSTGIEEYTLITNFMCANMIYDLNGKKGPNTVGKDVGFITVFYPYDSQVVAPLPNSKLFKNLTAGTASAACRGLSDEMRVPSLHELLSIAINDKLVYSGTINSSYIFSSTPDLVGNIWTLVPKGTFYELFSYPKSTSGGVMCVKR